MIVTLDWTPVPDGWIVSEHGYNTLRAAGMQPVHALDAMCWASACASRMGCLPEMIEVQE
jgi:hypothetical protein